MQLVMEILVSIFLLIGSFFMLVGGIGMVRLPDLFMRLHAPTKSSTLGLGSFLIAAMIFSAFQGRFGFAELLLTLLAFITAPVSANLMAQAALHLRLRSTGGEVPETLERPLPWQRSRRPPPTKDKNNSHDDLS
ncbi:Na+/H+ antiporter subunit G [Acinetobacter sp. ANC 5378]|uniref:Na+/H+ antiporter subunit G n=1 Tax=Acinetobacter sp. ANC 5378 TaxID=2731249 RepID=UPI00149081A8|nr:Na+/H+ antiporter subunit G [Acinetobacter sp. ANC 5378]NNG81283.1 Na+/H+ antiporter subunit G [Acinetobacter sp. ANC 5378]